MEAIQLDLFGWNGQNQATQANRPADSEITVDELADALIQYFGSWVGKHQKLLEDDWTICEELITIHKRFTRRQLRLVYNTDVWRAAWKRFNEFYLTNRTRGDAFSSEGWTFSVTMPELDAFKQQALGEILSVENLEQIRLKNRELCVYGYSASLFLVVTPVELARLQKWYKPYWRDIGQQPITIDGVQILIFGVEDSESVEPLPRRRLL